MIIQTFTQTQWYNPLHTHLWSYKPLHTHSWLYKPLHTLMFIQAHSHTFMNINAHTHINHTSPNTHIDHTNPYTHIYDHTSPFTHTHIFVITHTHSSYKAWPIPFTSLRSPRPLGHMASSKWSVWHLLTRIDAPKAVPPIHTNTRCSGFMETGWFADIVRPRLIG